MRLIEDLPTRRVFEKRGDETNSCIPQRASGQNEIALKVTLLVVMALITASLAKGSIQDLLDGDTTSGKILFALINSLVFCACVLGIVKDLWRYRSNTKNRVIHYVFDLTENTLSIEENGSKPFTIISSDKFQSFVVEFNPPYYAPPCHGLVLSGGSGYQYQIYRYNEPPPSEFISALTAIGLRKLDKLKTP